MLSRKKIFIISLITIPCILLLLAFVFASGERYFISKTATENQRTLRLTTAGLGDALLRYEAIPKLLAEKRDFIEILKTPSSPLQRNQLNLKLKQIASDVNASDIYLIQANGDTIVSSNFDREFSFVGSNFNYRPYFSKAVKGTPATYFALGTNSGKRGFYFSAPVKSGGEIVGVVALKILLDSIENNWRGSNTKIIAVDKHGVIFLSSNEDWLFNSLGALSTEAISEIKDDRRYPLERLVELSVLKDQMLSGDITMLSIDDGNMREEYIASSAYMAIADWELYVLTPRELATSSAYRVMAFTLLALLLLMAISSIILWRRAQMMQNMQLQQRTQDELESRVEARTNDLNQANKKLRLEVGERTQAEKQLRVAQRELVQAGKLAALGQMSAALSHELNQPLAAIKTYADNAKSYLKLNKADKASVNIGHISEMADRMAELGNHLRNFARKPKQAIDTVDLKSVIDGVDKIIAGRLKADQGQMNFDIPADEIWVKGGQVRLQQVLLNLFTNALDAMQSIDVPIIDVCVITKNESVEVSVRDYGRGIDEKDLEHIFDPFFTTKDVNEGLGLGLSISYNIVQDFGGALKVENHDDGGAVFRLILLRADKLQIAAE